MLERVARHGAQHGGHRVVVQLQDLGDHIQCHGRTKRAAIGRVRVVQPLPHGNQQQGQHLKQQVGTQVAVAGEVGQAPPGNAGNGAHGQYGCRQPGIAATDVAVDAGQQAGAGQRDGQAVPDQAGIVRRQVIPGRTYRRQQQRAKKQAIARPAAPQCHARAGRGEMPSAPERNQGKADVRRHVAEMRDAETQRLVGEIVITLRLVDGAVEQRNGCQHQGDGEWQVMA